MNIFIAALGIFFIAMIIGIIVGKVVYKKVTLTNITPMPVATNSGMIKTATPSASVTATSSGKSTVKKVK